jgi:SynChlorMet cassette protein ScmC
MQKPDHNKRTAAVGLCLADGASWNIVAENSEAEPFVERLTKVMGLGSANGVGRELTIQIQKVEDLETEYASMPGSLRSLFIEALADYPWEEECRPLKRPISCNFSPNGDEQKATLQLMHVSSVFTVDAMTRGGNLFHGALIERDGMGVILAGPGGAGKTTTCSRLPKPWRSLSDDLTLVVRDNSGRYWAHPWPTWSRFLDENVGGSWDVGVGVCLKAICYLSQSSELDLIPPGEGERVCLGMEAIEQANRALTRALNKESNFKLNNLCFRNLCQMVKGIPGYRLNLDLESPFWELIEERIY